MRLLLITPEFPPSFGGGISTYYRTLAPELARRGHDVRVVVGSAFSMAKQEQVQTVDGLPVTVLGAPRFHRHHDGFSRYAALPTLRRHLSAASALWELACEGPDFDLVEATDWGLLALPAILSNRTPVLVGLHGSVGQIDAIDPQRGEEAAGEFFRLIERSAFQHAGHLQTLSDANAEFWRKQTGQPVSVVRPVFPSLDDGAAAPRDGAGVVLGRIQSWKGPETLCQALDLMGKGAPTINWYGRDVQHSGSSATTSEYLGASYSKVWKRLIHPHAPLVPEEAKRMQRSALFNVVPSDWDVFNFTAVEALSSGRPTIVSTGAGAVELIEDGVSGIVFEAGNPESLARALRKVLQMEEAERLEMGRSAALALKARLDPARLIDEKIGAYEALLGSWRSVNRPEPAPKWLTDSCRTRPGGAEEFAFLDRLSLKPLTNSIGRRLFKKLQALWKR